MQPNPCQLPCGHADKTGCLFGTGSSCHKYHFCRGKRVFVITKVSLSRQMFFMTSILLLRQTRVFRDRSFVMTKMILVGAPANDSTPPDKTDNSSYLASQHMSQPTPPSPTSLLHPPLPTVIHPPALLPSSPPSSLVSMLTVLPREVEVEAKELSPLPSACCLV